jgi:hypothetical protein
MNQGQWTAQTRATLARHGTKRTLSSDSSPKLSFAKTSRPALASIFQRSQLAEKGDPWPPE